MLGPTIDGPDEAVDAVLSDDANSRLVEQPRQVGIDLLLPGADDAVGRVGRLGNVRVVGVQEAEGAQTVAQQPPQLAVPLTDPMHHRNHVDRVGEVALAGEGDAGVHDHQAHATGAQRERRQRDREEFRQHWTAPG